MSLRIVVACRDAAPIIQAAELDLDPVSPLVSAPVVAYGLTSRLPAWDDGVSPCLSTLPEPFGTRQQAWDRCAVLAR